VIEIGRGGERGVVIGIGIEIGVSGREVEVEAVDESLGGNR
jgi:hypothetical protein